MKTNPFRKQKCTFQYNRTNKTTRLAQFSRTRGDRVGMRRVPAVGGSPEVLVWRGVAWPRGCDDAYLRPNLLYMEKLV